MRINIEAIDKAADITQAVIFFGHSAALVMNAINLISQCGQNYFYNCPPYSNITDDNKFCCSLVNETDIFSSSFAYRLLCLAVSLFAINFIAELSKEYLISTEYPADTSSSNSSKYFICRL